MLVDLEQHLARANGVGMRPLNVPATRDMVIDLDRLVLLDLPMLSAQKRPLPICWEMIEELPRLASEAVAEQRIVLEDQQRRLLFVQCLFNHS